MELERQPIGIVKGVTGFQSTNSTFEALGEEGEIIPKSDINTFSLFDVEEFTVGDVTYELGGRAEWYTINPDIGFNSSRDVKVKDVEYFPLSGSGIGVWQINDQHQLSLGFTHSQRAPQIQELFSDGFHHATRSYERGNADLNKEISNNIDLGYRFNSSWMSTKLIYSTTGWVITFISNVCLTNYLMPKMRHLFPLITCVIKCPPVLESQQADATFKGFEAQAIFPLMINHYGALDLTLFSDYTRGTFDNGKDVPRMPPLRYGFQLSYEKDDFTSNLRFTRAEAQNNAGDNETDTKGYLLLNLQAQYRLASFHESEVLLFAKGKNLLDENIRTSTSYLRNFAPEAGRSADWSRISY